MTDVQLEDIGTVFNTPETPAGSQDQVKPIDVLTPAELLAQQNATRFGEVSAAAERAGSFVTGADQEEVDAILAGVQSGIYSAADALGRLSNITAAGQANLGSGGDGDETGGDEVPIEVTQRRENAFAIVSAFLQRAKLQGLEANIRTLLAQGIEDSNAILFNLRETTQFKTRFKANARRVENGLPELDPATYIGLEQEYANVLRANRLPTTFYDAPEDFEKLIEGAVSPAEFQARINEGFAKVRDADPQVLNTLRQFYPEVGNDENALAAYFIDPKRGADVLERQVQAARIGARAQEQGRMGIGKLTAEELVSRGYTPEVAQGVFERVGQLAGLYQEMGGEEALTEQEKVGAAFGYNVEAQQRLERRRAQRVGEFQAGGQFARTTGATSGTVETGVGTAQ